MRKTRSKKRNKNLAAAALSLALVISLLSPAAAGNAAAGQTFSLKQARSLAYANSAACRQIRSKLALEQGKYEDALKSVSAKQKNMSTFRWSPLLDFHFPEQPNLQEAYEWQYKPSQIQTQVTSFLHKLSDAKYQDMETISNLYVKAYTLQEKTGSEGKTLDKLMERQKKEEILAKEGKVPQESLEKTKQALDKMNSALSLDRRQLETAKEKMSALVGQDVDQDTVFENPMVSASIKREALSALQDYALKMDQGYYEAKLNSRLGLMSLEVNEKLMKAHYGKKMNGIQMYINQAKTGAEIDGEAFKAAYDDFLRNIEKPWNGKFHILFLAFPKDWLKGSLDGIRYVEGDPYTLYTAALNYQDLKNQEKEVMDNLSGQVSDSFEALITAGNSYEAVKKSVQLQKRAVDKNTVLNQLGRVTFEELSKDQEAYEKAQSDELSALSSYTQLLYSFDRLTCGGASAYLEAQSSGRDMTKDGKKWEQTGQGEANGGQDKGNGRPSYHIHQEAEDNVFVLGVTLPKESSLKASDFELWVNDTQVGERTPVDQELSHLTLTLNNVDKAEVKLYESGSFTAVCAIDPMAESGTLTPEQKDG